MLSTSEAVRITSFCIGKTYGEIIEAVSKKCDNLKNMEEEEQYKGNLINKKAISVEYFLTYSNGGMEIFEIQFEKLSTHWSGLNLIYKDGRLVEVFRARYS